MEVSSKTANIFERRSWWT